MGTDIISDLIRNPQGKSAKRIAELGENNICTSIIVAAELRYGCAKQGSNGCLSLSKTCSARSTSAVRRACRFRLWRHPV
jgi:predicted nucleic acid-binding protein